VKDFATASAGPGSSALSSPASDAARVSVDDLTPHLRCGLCREHVAGSLVLSCGHLFCGSCLSDHLIASPSCPACQMSLRAIPVRCIAIDHVVAALLPALPAPQREAHAHRKERGESAPSIIAKMLWWLEAGAPEPAAAAAAARCGGGGGGGGGAGMLLQHGQLARAGSGAGGGMHPQAAAAAGYAGVLGAQAQGAAAAHEAAMAAAMAAAAQFGAGMAPHLGGMGLGGGMPGGAAAMGGLAGLAGGRPDMLAHTAGLHEPSMAAYHAALHSMQSAAALQAGLPGAAAGHGAFLGAAGRFPQLGGLMGM
jgi:hypothetical protein